MHIESWCDQTTPGLDGLSPFQVLCETKLRDCLGKVGVELVKRRLEPSSDAGGLHVFANLGESGWQLFIAEDFVGVARGDEELIRLEEWDAASPAELVDLACERLQRAVREGVISIGTHQS
jgi:hypothetical protein